MFKFRFAIKNFEFRLVWKQFKAYPVEPIINITLLKTEMILKGFSQSSF